MQVYRARSPRRIARTAETSAGNERRSKQRFPLHLPLVCRELHEGEKILVGETINISSKGLLFTVAESLPTHKAVGILVDWPAVSSDGKSLKLELFARTVRSAGTLVAAQIWSHHIVPLETGGEDVRIAPRRLAK